MGKVNYSAFKKTPGPNGTPSEYTDLQYKALDKITKTDRPLRLRAARPEYMNHILLPDGTISADVQAMLTAVEKQQKIDRDAFVSFQKENTQAILDDALSPDLRQTYIELKQWGNHDWLTEVTSAIQESRFLFVVDANMTPRIYFQCDVPNNPDVEPLEPAAASPAQPTEQ